MEAERIPYARVDQDMILCSAGTEGCDLVTLREVGEVGLAYTYKTGEVEGVPIFVPWISVN